MHSVQTGELFDSRTTFTLWRDERRYRVEAARSIRLACTRQRHARDVVAVALLLFRSPSAFFFEDRPFLTNQRGAGHPAG